MRVEGTAPAAVTPGLEARIAPASAAPGDCPRCRSASRPGRLTLRYLFARVREETVGSERGFALTLWTLLVAPRRVVEAFLHDADRRYFGPVKYFLVATAISILLMPTLPLFDGAIASMLQKQGLASASVAQAWVADWNGVLYAPLLVMLALTTRVFFRASGLNLAEHLVIATYAWSQMVLISALAFGLAALLKQFGIRGAWLLPLVFAATVYWFWYAAQVFRLRGIGDALRCLIIVPFALMLYFIAMLGVVALGQKLFAG
jgi:hypothetical protein